MTFIAAPSGFRLVRAFKGETGLGSDPAAVSEIVLAFKIGGDEDYPVPITPTGPADPEKLWLLVHPDGNYSMGGDQYSGFGEWQKEMGLDGWKPTRRSTRRR